MTWTKAEETELRRLAKSNELFYSEIAKRMGKNEQVVRWKARALGLGRVANHRMGSWNAKHVHICEEAMAFFQNHSAEETMLKFRLTKSEWKSLSLYAYSRKKYQHLRKDTRTHNKWTVEELLFLLRHAGLRQRSWIAQQIKRGSARVIKEKLMSMRVNTKTLNGMTLSSYQNIFCQRPAIMIEGDAGPNRSGLPTNFKIVPWVVIYEELLAGIISAPKVFWTIAETMSRFQYWIHGNDPVQNLKTAATVGLRAPEINRTFMAEV